MNSIHTKNHQHSSLVRENDVSSASSTAAGIYLNDHLCCPTTNMDIEALDGKWQDSFSGIWLDYFGFGSCGTAARSRDLNRLDGVVGRDSLKFGVDGVRQSALDI
jgi:hypothetical protein